MDTSVDSHFICEETKAWRDEQSAPEHMARRWWSQNSNQAVRPGIRALNHCALLCLTSGEDEFHFGRAELEAPSRHLNPAVWSLGKKNLGHDIDLGNT